MNQQASQYDGQRQRQHKTRKWLKYLRLAVLMLNALAIIALWTCCISTWLPPASFPKLSLLGLLFPAFLLGNLSFVLVWLFVNYKRVWIPLAATLPCLGFVLDYCPISFRKDVPDHSLKLVTWNSEYFGTEIKDKTKGKQTSLDFLLSTDADIICMQETPGLGHSLDIYFEKLLNKGYKIDEHNNNLIFTKLPIITSDTIAYYSHRIAGSKGNSSKWYLLKNGNDTILLINNHLESNHIDLDVKETYVKNLKRPKYESLKKSGRTLASKLSSANKIRGTQTDSLVAFVKRNERKHIILCGDMNDTPISYTYHELKGVLKSAYRESGRGLGFSYNQRGFWVRIDHIFVSHDCTTYYTYVDKSIKVSDHYPVISWLKFE